VKALASLQRMDGKEETGRKWQFGKKN